MLENMTAPRIKILPLGACQIQQPIAALHLAGHVRSAFVECGIQPAPFVYTIKAARQLLAVLRGDEAIDPALARFCFMLMGSEEMQPQQILPGCDLAIIEPNYPADIVAEGLILSQQLIKRHLTDPLSTLGPDVRKLCFNWKSKGLLQQDEEIRKSTAAALLKIVPDDMADCETISWVLRHARGVLSHDREVAADLVKLQETLGIPCAIALYAWRYLDDGNPESQPAGFRASVRKMAKLLNMPILDLSGLVRRVGVANAMRPDKRHFQADFLPLAGRSVLYFLEKNHEYFRVPKSRLTVRKNSVDKSERHRRLEAAREAERIGHLSLALRHYRAMIEANEEDSGALKGRRRVAQRLGLYAEAYEAAEILARREPHIPAHALVLAKYARLAKLQKPVRLVRLAEAS